MGKRLFYWELAGALFTAAMGTLLHFVYDWSGVTLLPAFMLDSLRVYQMENIRENKRDDKIISCRFTVCLGRDIK